MKTKYFLTLAAISSIALSSCEDLDTLPDGSTVTSQQKEEIAENKPERAEAGVTAIFAQFTQYGPNYTAFGGLRHNDIGYPSIMMATDANGQDVVMENNGYNWAAGSLDYSDRTNTSYESQMVWNDLYQIIFNTNNVISSIDPETEDSQSQFFLAQGLAGRGFAYLTLAQLYQFNYKGHESSPCVPLITNENSNEAALNGAERSTVSEVFTLIKQDLDTAIELLSKSDYARKDKRYIDLATAYGLRARMNLVMQNYPEAAADATSAIENSSATPSSLDETGLPAFWDSESENNWMWGIIVAETDDVVSSGIVNWISHNGTFNYGYCWYSGGHQISKSLYNTISDTDVRKSWWSDGEGKNTRLTPAYQQFLVDYGYRPYTSCKFAPYGGYSDANLGADTNANDMPLMRIEEMYYIKAEAEAITTESTATLVNFVKTYRDPEYQFNGGNVQDEILRQKRIEFWGEGLIWYDFMRLNKGIDRRGAGYPNSTMVFNIPAGDNILLWRIPETEIQANPALTEDENNPVAPTPSPVADI